MVKWTILRGDFYKFYRIKFGWDFLCKLLGQFLVDYLAIFV
jgi:hypothetical protein